VTVEPSVAVDADRTSFPKVGGTFRTDTTVVAWVELAMPSLTWTEICAPV
jgi:hypothetical protein